MVCENQDLYYQALRDADKVSDCTDFIEFMLRVIDDSLKVSISDNLNQKNDGKNVGNMSEDNKKLPKTALQILIILQDNTTITIQLLAQQLGVTTRTVERNIKLLQENNRLKLVGSTNSGHWLVINK
ncbi:helix-turn-helix domain-containing protein [Orbus wheelerorum]|uniref:HTH domain-containing protein n=1 Tax=Orbus wheelerorum TaxID=3074111 RepID=UPI00370D8499